jgi:hypothetical protein
MKNQNLLKKLAAFQARIQFKYFGIYRDYVLIEYEPDLAVLLHLITKNCRHCRVKHITNSYNIAYRFYFSKNLIEFPNHNFIGCR